MGDNVAWKEANDDLDAAIKTVRDMVSSLRLDVDARRRKVDEILATIRHDIQLWKQTWRSQRQRSQVTPTKQ